MTPDEIAAMKAENDRLKAENEKFKAAPPKKDDPAPPPKKDDPPKDDPTLLDKVRREKEAEGTKATEIRAIETAVKFNHTIHDFVKGNADVLPSEIAAVVKAADSEKYDSARERATAIRGAIVQSFFSQQSNLDLLTESQKATFSDYLKLTKNGKEEKADTIYENLFEPAFESLKRVKKAEEVGRSRAGLASGSKAEDEYKNRLVEGSRKFYLGDKGAS